MAKKRAKRQNQTQELDGVYFLKIVAYLILGSFWVRFVNGSSPMEIPIPVGLISGVLLARHERLQIDRKIEYAILLMAMFIGFWLPMVMTINY